MKPLLLTLAAWLTGFATAAFLLGWDGDFKASAVIAALCLGCMFALDLRDYERARMARYREQVWREREAGR